MNQLPPNRFSTIVFLDTETTGLPGEGFHPRITELALVAVNRSEMMGDGCALRAQNKLVVCFNPMSKILSEASVISGLNSRNLYNQKDFDDMAVQQIRLFLLRLEPPLCVIAQNGYRFDFPLLNAEIFRVMMRSYGFIDCRGNPVYCTDSLQLFRHFSDKLVPVSSDVSNLEEEVMTTGPPLSQSTPKKLRRPFSLACVYESVFGSVHDGAHSAEGDCIAIMKLVQFIGDRALSWIDNNYRILSNVGKMYICDEADGLPLPTGQFPHEVGLASYDCPN
ncbi:Three-prime repair exonuclease 1 [Echinococcus granulosus]|uniref:Three prime repair exonuclease n=1 Tax=Echinococcus granulosus TaxID=6210 RepID=U6J1H9_ECHGR|nr:Three prime repair exonuclease [Echinococcus granulosus]EUB64893.1 Three prime repair exonuclease [Echinococcus granulosus]KAH9286759.1 Three-prime repair exonuclease 1 [Echinococcus granulosus]CDS15571.1 three prime repair exonuclease 1 [Echinococcus granulosus]